MKPTPRLFATLVVCLALGAVSCDNSPVKNAYATLEADPLLLDFGLQQAGQKKTLPLKLSNTGNYTLNISDVLLRNDKRGTFAFGTAPTEIASGADVTVDVTYTAPEDAGSDSAQLVVVSDANNAPELAVSLSARANGRCAPGYAFCEGECVDIVSDSTHCGDCVTACAAPDKCIYGKCGCEPKACTGNACGLGDDGCGKELDCGACAPPLVCLSLVCVPPSCTDLRQDGDETDLDCGGSCPPCKIDGKCSTSKDCDTGLACIDGKCSRCRTIDDCPFDQVCKDGLCGPCATRDECRPERACLAGRCLSCPDEAAFNECGLCGGAPVSYVGATCTATSG